MIPRDRQMILQKTWLSYSRSTPGPWQTKEKIFKEDPLGEGNATIVIAQDTLFMIVHMRDVKTSPISLCLRRRSSPSLQRGRMTRHLFMKNTCLETKMTVMMIKWARPPFPCMHATTSSSTTGLFDSPNKDKPFTHRCLMAKEVKTKSKSIPMSHVR